MNAQTITNIILGLLLAATTGLGGWAFKRVDTLHTDVALLKQTVDRLQTADSVDEGQTRQLQRMWDLHSWAKDRINEGRVADGKDLVSWPVITNFGN